MKKVMIFTVLSISLLAFRSDIDKSQARAEQVQGLYVFLFSDPVNSYQVIGTVKKSGMMKNLAGEQADKVISDLVEKARKQFPQADGILVHGADLNKADVIQYK